MGFFLRKSIKLGKYLRLNLSNSGPGLSFGTRGVRISRSRRGTQINLGEGGLYFRKSLGSGCALSVGLLMLAFFLGVACFL